MTVRRLGAYLILIAFLVRPALADGLVRADDYNAYWLWAGVKGRPLIYKAKTLYLLQGEIGPNRAGQVGMTAQGGSVPGAHAPALWLAYRVRSLEWPPAVLVAILRKYAAWRAEPGQVLGIQVDFDASTRELKNYAGFLRTLRAALPPDCGLSVTGLMDWASQARPEDLDTLSGTVDEIIFQTYRGRQTVPDIGAYLARLSRLHIPFRLGLAEGADWSAPADLEANPHFRGYVVFLQNPR